MTTESIIKNWDYKHFVMYLSICAAEADFVVSDDEMEVIKNRMKKLGISGLNFKSMYNEVHSTFELLKDIQSIEVIRGLGERFCNDQGTKENILKMLKEIANADDQTKQVEKNLIREVKWLLDKYSFNQ